MKSLQVKAFDTVENIISNIVKGNLLHRQEAFHTETSCGTSHCIAGWFTVYIAKELDIDLSYTKRFIDEDECFMEVTNLAEIVEAYLSKELDGDKELKDVCYEEIHSFVNAGVSMEWGFAATVLGLSLWESDNLFSGIRSIEEIQSNFRLIKESNLG